VLYGGRVSILIGVTGAFFGSFIGVVLGSIAGYFGGWIDATLIRISEVFQTFPEMILILILGAVLGQGVGNLLFIFAIPGWMTTFRMVRNEFLALRSETYVQVCEAFGMSKPAIMFKQILPNVLSPVIVSTTVNIAGFILSEAGLSFLGVGVPSSVPTWGNILNAAKSIEVVSNYWWLWVVPGAVITIFVLAINFFGDGLRDVLDPKQQ
jgi:peptide/nickel transport system permease protein